MWVARDKDGKLHLTEAFPKRQHIEINNTILDYWAPDLDYLYPIHINDSLFPELTWNDDPIEVEFTNGKVAVTEQDYIKYANKGLIRKIPG